MSFSVGAAAVDSVIDSLENDEFGKLTEDETRYYVVWSCFMLNGWKALVATDLTDEGYYWEVTYNKHEDETYVDRYKKVSTIVLTD